MSDAIIVTTKVGDLAVSIHGSDRATVRAAGAEERVQVGRFAYRLHIYFTRSQGGDWRLDPEYNSNSVYHTEGISTYFTAPAPTIKAKILAAAREALLKALAEDPLSPLRGDVESTNRTWVHAQSDLEKAKIAVELAQKTCNKAELAYYDAQDRLKKAEQS